MARQTKTSGKSDQSKVEGEVRQHTLCNVARHPELREDGTWKVSPKGNLLFGILCFPTNVDVSTVKPKGKPNVDSVNEWKIKIDETEFSPAEAAELAIGTGYVKDSTSGLCYVTKDMEGMDAIDSDLKKEVITRSKRISVQRKLNTACMHIDAVAKMQGLADCFNADEKIAIFNPLAALLKKYQDKLFQTEAPKPKGAKPVYVAL